MDGQVSLRRRQPHVTDDQFHNVNHSPPLVVSLKV